MLPSLSFAVHGTSRITVHKNNMEKQGNAVPVQRVRGVSKKIGDKYTNAEAYTQGVPGETTSLIRLFISLRDIVVSRDNTFKKYSSHPCRRY